MDNPRKFPRSAEHQTTEECCVRDYNRSPDSFDDLLPSFLEQHSTLNLPIMMLPSCSQSYRSSKKLFSSLVGVMVWFPSASFAQCVEQLKGKTYSELPRSICPSYTDMLLGRFEQKDYGAVICDQPQASYILIQRLLKYTAAGKAVWQVLQIKKVPRLQPQYSLLSVGCRRQNLNDSQTDEPIFALVAPGKAADYSTISAWKIDLKKVTFLSLNPALVSCSDLTL